jgi:outer membrane protein assembly factor BamB
MSEEPRHLASHRRAPEPLRTPNPRLLVSMIGLFLTLAFLIGGLRWISQQGISFGVTPTVTPTRKGATPTYTPDFRATQNAVEAATQRAHQLAMIGVETPTPEFTATPSPTVSPTPTLVGIPPATEVFTIPLPLIGSPGNLVSPVATPVNTEEAEIQQTAVSPLETPTPTSADDSAPDDSGSPVETPTEIPTVTPTEIPTVTPTDVPTVTPTVTVQPVVLQAYAKPNTVIRMGPSSLYTQTAILVGQQRLLLRGRDPGGEWIYVCCEYNVEGWTRQAKLDLRDNQLPPGAPSDANANDVRWLAERESTVHLANPLPVPTQIPLEDYPLFRRDPGAQARLDRPLAAAYVPEWPRPAEAFGAMSSSVVVAGSSVLAANQDRHLYNIEKETGNQRWRLQFDALINHVPAVHGSTIYVVDTNGSVFALRDLGNQTELLWRSSIPTAPAAPPNLYGNILLISGANNRLYAFDRLDSTRLWEVEVSGSRLQYPVVGGQLVFAGNAGLQALDLYAQGNMIWEKTDLASAVSAPPVYTQPGVLALAEVYAATENGNIHSYDAATGRALWSQPHTSGDRTEFLAVSGGILYASGSNFIKAVDRRNGQQIWRYPFSDRIMGGPIVGGDRLLFVSESGAVQVLNAMSGALISNTDIRTRIAGAPAVSGGRIFIPAVDNALYALREAN